MSVSRERQVIFGSGPVGSTIAEELSAQGKSVRLVNRSGKAEVPANVAVVAADALNAESVLELTRDAGVIYHCMNVPYPLWGATLARLQTNLIAGAEASGAKLVITDTLYVYGQTGGRVMTEATPYAATTRKGRLRAELATAYLQAHRAGRVRVAIGRAADFFGPRVLNSSFGDRVFPAALGHKPTQLLGNSSLPHSYSYMKDVARGLIILAEHDEALGRDWLLPVGPALSQREMVQHVEALLGYRLRIQAIPKALVRLLGISDAFLREFVEMMYQYAEPQIVDSSAFTRAFGIEATPLDEALETTIRWYELYLAQAK